MGVGTGAWAGNVGPEFIQFVTCRMRLQTTVVTSLPVPVVAQTSINSESEDSDSPTPQPDKK